MKIISMAALFALAVAGCAAPPHGGALPIHQEGVAARLRLACGLGIGTATGGTCTSEESADAETQGTDGIEEADASSENESDAVGAAAADPFD